MDTVAQLTVIAVALFATYSVASLGFLLTYIPAQFFNFASAIPIVLSPYVTIVVTGATGSFLLGAAVGVAVSAALGALIHDYAVRPLLKAGYPPTILLVASLGIYTAFVGLIALAFGEQSLRVDADGSESWPLGAGVFVSSAQAVAIVVALLSAVVLIWLWRGTLAGLRLRAIADDAALASIVGIPVQQLSRLAFALGFAMLGAAGLLVALDSSVRPGFAFPIIVVAMVAAAVSRGARRLTAVWVTVAIVAVAETAVSFVAGQAWARAVSFAALVLAVFWAGASRHSDTRGA